MVADTVLSAPSPDRALRHGRLEGCPMLLYRFIAVIGSEEVPIIHRRDPSPRRVPFRWSCDYLVLLSERDGVSESKRFTRSPFQMDTKPAHGVSAVGKLL
jgi:hypothetical protein